MNILLRSKNIHFNRVFFNFDGKNPLRITHFYSEILLLARNFSKNFEIKSDFRNINFNFEKSFFFSFPTLINKLFILINRLIVEEIHIDYISYIPGILNVT